MFLYGLRKKPRQTNKQTGKKTSLFSLIQSVKNHAENLPSVKWNVIQGQKLLNMVSAWVKVDLCRKWTSFIHYNYGCSLAMVAVRLL